MSHGLTYRRGSYARSPYVGASPADSYRPGSLRRRAFDVATAAFGGEMASSDTTSPDWLLYTLSPVHGEALTRVQDRPALPPGDMPYYWALFAFGIDHPQFRDEGGAALKTIVGDAGDALADLGAGLERKARAELLIKAATVGVAAIGAIGLLAYALRG